MIRAHTRSRRALLITLLVAATVASALVAALNIFLVQSSGSVVADAMSLPVVGGSQLAGMPDGARLVVEGTISAQSTPILRTLVAYYRQEGSTLYEMSWGPRAQNSAPFVLDAAGGPVRIANSQYALVNAPAAPADHYFGFQIGDRVAVIGSVTRDANGPALTAERLIAGDWTSYVLVQLAGLLLPVAATFACASLLAAILTR